MSVSVNNLFDGTSVMTGDLRDRRHTHPLLIIEVEATIWVGRWYPRATVLLERIVLRTIRLGVTEDSIQLNDIIRDTTH